MPIASQSLPQASSAFLAAADSRPAPSVIRLSHCGVQSLFATRRKGLEERSPTTLAWTDSFSTASRMTSSVCSSCCSALGQSRVRRPATSSSRTLTPIAWCAVRPLRRFRCKRSTTRLRRSRNVRSSRARSRQSASESEPSVPHAARSWFSTSSLRALLECSSRQKRPSPASFSRRWTTSSAAVFSDTKRTVFSFPSRWAIRLEMVWLLPVPGGPMMTKSLPRSAVATAAVCDESAGSGISRSEGSNSRSSDDAWTKSIPVA